MIEIREQKCMAASVFSAKPCNSATLLNALHKVYMNSTRSRPAE
jgi:hypothetical protein